MEFKSQICTTKEQSERLLALGFNTETADMGLIGDIPIILSTTWANADPIFDTPAWSLHRLIEMLPPGYREQIRVGTTDNPYEYMYQVIGRLVYVGEFNKEYLK